jgi:hypothetical protein
MPARARSALQRLRPSTTPLLCGCAVCVFCALAVWLMHPLVTWYRTFQRGLPHAVPWHSHASVDSCVRELRMGLTPATRGGWGATVEQDMPFCKAVSPTAGCALLAFKEQVQIPAISEWQCMQRRWRNDTSRSSSAAVSCPALKPRYKWLLFQVTPDPEWANQMYGVSMALSLALMLDRAFGVCDHTLVPVQHVLRSGVLPWDDNHFVPPILSGRSISTGSSQEAVDPATGRLPSF